MPVMGSAGAELYAELWQIADNLDETYDYVLAKVCEALGKMRQQSMDLFEDREVDGHLRAGYSQMLDVERAPVAVLPYLAQFVGAAVTVGAPEEQQRDEVRRKAGQARGRPASLISAVQATLTGDRTVRLIERVGGNAWQVVVITRTAETPDAAATLKAALSQKPIGIVLTHIVSDAPIVDEMTLTIDGLTEAIDDLTVGGVT